jgi:RNA polymerase sigma-70 factor, ECF subfamily
MSNHFSQFQTDPTVGESRVNRARSKLAYLLDLTSEAEIGPDDTTKAALAAG